MFSATSGMKRTPKVRQACDPCHVRKVRCDGGKPCNNCISTDLTCTYLAVPKKKGPKGKRPKITHPKPTKLPYVLNQVPPASARDASPSVQDILGFETPSIPSPVQETSTPPNDQLPCIPEAQVDVEIEEGSSGFAPSPLVTEDVLKSCLDAFFTHKYPIMPILDRDQTYNGLSGLRKDAENYALMAALSAVIVQQPEIIDGHLSTETNSWPSSDVLIEETKRARQCFDHIEKPSLSTVQTSFFLFAALFCLGKDNSAYYYIREAITMLQLLRLHDENTYSNLLDVQYRVYCRRTFWLLFITERAYALQRHRPLTLQRTIRLPTVHPGPESTILSGFLDLVSLFQNFDDTFLSLWNLSETGSPSSTQSLVQLQDILKFAIPNVSERTEIQQADLLISRQWLKTMVWQLCVSKRLLSSASKNESMSFHYPVTIARDVILVSRLLPPKAFEAHGIGILEKVFDIGCSLADVLSLHPGSLSVSAPDFGPRDYLMELVRILGISSGGKKYLGLLASKADECLGARVHNSLSDFDICDRLIEELSEDEIDSTNQGNSRIPIDGDYTGIEHEPRLFDNNVGCIYTNIGHVAPFVPITEDSDNFGYHRASMHDIDHPSNAPFSGIGRHPFAHPIAYTALNRQSSE